ncbi:hypothetical protein FB567DRAFT_523307 [Paraphoma chrysanthemicola]|uniref:Uncharacterized protein n=1 Tax=Paraphoma chrysanthemicola TaxID=798071 RepID=A0A8K0R8B9_9PLEO|nr:hypothetical protein FB567DRAFT_523307 [Paraphoma chrysanthemicola]
MAEKPLFSLGQRLLRLPRELRDLVYSYIVREDSPIDLTNGNIQISLGYPIVSAEWLEAVYTHNICSVTFNDSDLGDSIPPRSLWGTFPSYKRHIRDLEVNATEILLQETELEALELECTTQQPGCRRHWNELLELPRLETLTIKFQKENRNSFAWANFSPILYRLRELNPRLRITFNVSFDNILEKHWSVDPFPHEGRGGRILGAIEDEPYLPMGFVDMSELVKPPCDADRAYVEEHLLGSRGIGSRDVVRGLLDETPAHRRVLAECYVVKEPPLLRFLMAEHYTVYKAYKERRLMVTVQ